MKKQITPRIEETAIEFLAGTFGSKYLGLQYIAEAFQPLYRGSLMELRGKFSAAELSLILDVSNGLILTPLLAGQHVLEQCRAGIALDRLDKKWGVEDPDGFLARLGELPIFHASCLEVWAQAFRNDGRDLSDWVATLAA